MRNAEKETCELFFGNLDNSTVFILCLTIIELFNHGTHCLSFFSRVSIEYADERPCLVTAGQRWPDVYSCVLAPVTCRMSPKRWNFKLLDLIAAWPLEPSLFISAQKQNATMNLFDQNWKQNLHLGTRCETGWWSRKYSRVIEYRLYQSYASHQNIGTRKDMKKQWGGGDRHVWEVLC